MTPNDEFIGELEGYLEEYEGSTPLPEDVRDAIRAELPSTHQRPAWWPVRRTPEMNTFAKFGLAAAAVAVAALLGFNYLVAPNVGGPGLDDPSPTPNPQSLHQGSLSPATYMIDDPFPVRITFDVPEGWCSWISNSDVAGLVVDNVVDNSVEECHSGWGPAFWIVDNVYSDPCHPDSVFEPSLGPSVDDLVTALANLPGYEASTPTDITVSGFPGVQLELTAPEYGDECADHRTWTTASSEPRVMLPGETNRLQILDVDGVRLVLTLVEYAHTTEYEQSEGIPYDADAHVADQPELRQILDSMRIEGQP